jgi:hypothetical protein
MSGFSSIPLFISKFFKGKGVELGVASTLSRPRDAFSNVCFTLYAFATISGEGVGTFAALWVKGEVENWLHKIMFSNFFLTEVLKLDFCHVSTP